jgi:hypothetical protein
MGAPAGECAGTPHVPQRIKKEASFVGPIFDEGLFQRAQHGRDRGSGREDILKVDVDNYRCLVQLGACGGRYWHVVVVCMQELPYLMFVFCVPFRLSGRIGTPMIDTTIVWYQWMAWMSLFNRYGFPTPTRKMAR